MSDLDKTLTELEGRDWGMPPLDGSHLQRRIGLLRYKPLKEMTVGDLRVLIGQDMGIAWLLPLTLDELEQRPFAEGDYYRGDLLCSVLRIAPELLRAQPAQLKRLRHILKRVAHEINGLNAIDRKTLQGALDEAMPQFERASS
jgi:hypothetical protein